MKLLILSVTVWAAVFAALPAAAQSVADIGGPAEAPPSGFKGQQYVDSRGCVFLRAGYGGQANWVPRVARDRKALCGFPPTFGPKPVIEMADEVAPVAPVVVPEVAVAAAPAVKEPVFSTPARNKPMDTIASLKPAPIARVAVPVIPVIASEDYASATRTVAQTYQVAQGAGGSGRQIGCYADAPVAQRVRLTNGGTAVVCTKGAGSLNGWRPPIYGANAGVGAALTDGPAYGTTRAPIIGEVESQGVVRVQRQAAAQEVTAIPRGYKAAWDDDRLNPNRGKGTATGWADQGQVWSLDVPAELVADQQAKKAKKAAKKAKVSISTKSSAVEPAQPQVRAAAGGLYVQVGTFGVPENAAGAAQRLQAAGMPVARSKLTKGGKALQIVMAGPFASASEAQSALSAVRGAGFADAFIR